MQGVGRKWTKEMDEVLVSLAAKYPRGETKTFWSKVAKDALWRWKAISKYTMRERYKFLSDPSNVRLRKLNAQPKTKTPIPPIPQNQIPILNFCPHCGGNLSSFHAALQLNTLMNGAHP